MWGDRKPKLSVVLVAYDMDRELPRTLRSLSPEMQRGLSSSDYEVIVIDNGSPQPVDAEQVRALVPNSRVHRVNNAGSSPCGGTNKGIGLARGELVGVMIDGARMASPGLLAAAIEAFSLHPKAAIGTLAFHLGSKVQMESIHEGYNQSLEDELLESVDWVADGYRLFDIAVYAGSSSGGWFVLPAETNALFMSKDRWKRLGGYDERFASPGGGLVNLDVWRRICDDHSCPVVMLLGEATFHQVHGGIATNNPEHQAVVSKFFEEYKAIRGQDYQRPSRRTFYYGAPRPSS